VHESGRTRVTRLFLPGRTVIRKEPVGADAPGRLRHEVAMLRRLRDVAARDQPLPGPLCSISRVFDRLEPTGQQSEEAALAGRCQGVVVGEAPGVGKTALVDELREVVTGRDGWYDVAEAKSTKHGTPSSKSTTFAGVMSRCMTPRPCIPATARANRTASPISPSTSGGVASSTRLVPPTSASTIDPGYRGASNSGKRKRASEVSGS
jgi:hypothetical protein